MARHAAFGIADAHNLDHDGVSSITQGDLKLDQYLYVDGYCKFDRAKLDMFVLSLFIRFYLLSCAIATQSSQHTCIDYYFCSTSP